MTLGHEAAELAGHPSHSLLKAVGIGSASATVASVASYQTNTHLAKATGQAPPSLSLQTGGMPQPDTGQIVSTAGRNVKKKYIKPRKGGKHGN